MSNNMRFRPRRPKKKKKKKKRRSLYRPFRTPTTVEHHDGAGPLAACRQSQGLRELDGSSTGDWQEEWPTSVLGCTCSSIVLWVATHDCESRLGTMFTWQW